MNGGLTNRLKRFSLILGILFLITSIFLSYDGFDGTVNGRNSNYEIVAVTIGIILALGVSVLQFIFSSNVIELNWTLKIVGILSYAYSIYTNHLGAENLLSMDTNMSWIVALFLDVAAEPMIAWGMGESLIGDLFGNAGTIVFGDSGKGASKSNQTSYRQTGDAYRSPKNQPSVKKSEPYGGKYNKGGGSGTSRVSYQPLGNSGLRDRLAQRMSGDAHSSRKVTSGEEEEEEFPEFMKD